MKILHCPLNGPRPIQEFHFGGELRPAPDPETTSDEAWAEYVFHRNGAPGIKTEWWYPPAERHLVFGGARYAQ